MNQIDWYQKSSEELYDYFHDLEINEQVRFLIHLFGHYTKLDIAWVQMIEDTMNLMKRF